jgi:N,N'-diacetyllegionaminate synthase
MTLLVDIGGRSIGAGKPCLVIAEIGVNHNGDPDLGRRMIDAAADAGADAVKFQMFETDELVTPRAPKAGYQIETTGGSGTQRAMLRALEAGIETQRAWKSHCDDRGVLYLCTPYDEASADALDALGVAAYKVASTDTTTTPFLRHLASKGRPTILSTGMCTLGDVELGLSALLSGGLGLDRIVVLHCLSEYPAPMEQLNLRAIPAMGAALGCVMGYSDHTPGVGASPWAVVLGAAVVEKHFTVDRGLPGPDHRASIEPGELRELVAQIRQVEAALGDGVKRPMPSEIPNTERMRKSLVARRDIAAGEVLGRDTVTFKRPGSGLPPEAFYRLEGRPAARAVAKDTLLSEADVRWP